MTDTTSESAEFARDMGIARVAAKNELFFAQVIAFIERLPKGWTGITEDFKQAVLQAAANGEIELKDPSSPNAWGGITRWAASLGLLERTGEMRKPMERKSHARATQVWRRT